MDEANKLAWHRQLKFAREKNDLEKIDKLEKIGPEACDGQWCEIRRELLNE